MRQLGFVIEQSYVLECQPVLPGTLADDARVANLPFTHLGRLRQAAVEQALKTTGGHKGRAAELLGIHPNTLTRLLAQLSDQ